MYVTPRRVLWCGRVPTDTNGNPAKLIVQKKKSHVNDEAFLIPLDAQPHMAPFERICKDNDKEELRKIMARPYTLSKKMKFTVKKRSVQNWDSDFILVPTEQTGLPAQLN